MVSLTRNQLSTNLIIYMTHFKYHLTYYSTAKLQSQCQFIYNKHIYPFTHHLTLISKLPPFCKQEVLHQV